MATQANTKIAEPSTLGSRTGFEWEAEMRARHDPARKASLLDGRGARGQRRVLILGDYAAAFPKSDPKSSHATVFLYEEDGTLPPDVAGLWTLDNVA